MHRVGSGVWYTNDMKGIEVVTIRHPNEFRDGVRVLMRTLRSKEGGKVNKPDRVAEKVVSRNREEFYDIFNELMSRRKGQERIYSTVNPRNMEKAIRLFKTRQLDADYFDIVSKHSFYTDIYNRWISALQNPQTEDGSLFMVDIDEGEDDESDIRKQISANGIKIVHEYPTKNGKHFVLEPFNPSLVTFDVQKNGMILLAYNSYFNREL